MNYRVSRGARPACALLLVSVALSFSSARTEAAAAKITGRPVTSVTVGHRYQFRPTITDANAGKLTFSIVNKPGFASFSPATGELNGTPFANHARVWKGIVISVSDGTRTISLPAFSLTVRPNPDQSPVFEGDPVTTTAHVGVPFSFQPSARDPEGKRLTFSIRNKPTWATFSSATGRLTGTPTAPGITPRVMIIASDGVTSTAFQFVISVSDATNRPPVIAGSPATVAHAGILYRFRPSASDAERDALTFTIQNKPSWARFNTTTGELSGTPSASGTTKDIRIQVSDGKSVSALRAFSLLVIPTAVRGVVLGWTPPTEYADGTPLTGLAGYRIWYGASPADLSSSITINDPGTVGHVVEGLREGVWHFAITAFTRDGAESDNSDVISASVR